MQTDESIWCGMQNLTGQGAKTILALFYVHFARDFHLDGSRACQRDTTRVFIFDTWQTSHPTRVKGERARLFFVLNSTWIVGLAKGRALKEEIRKKKKWKYKLEGWAACLDHLILLKNIEKDAMLKSPTLITAIYFFS